MQSSLQHAALIGDSLALSFADGSERYVSLAVLRSACPCALCKGEPDVLGRVSLPPGVVADPVRSSEVRSVGMVGGYGLQIVWGDGHGSGIYALDLIVRLAALNSD